MNHKAPDYQSISPISRLELVYLITSIEVLNNTLTPDNILFRYDQFEFNNQIN